MELESHKNKGYEGYDATVNPRDHNHGTEELGNAKKNVHRFVAHEQVHWERCQEQDVHIEIAT
jgi:hypothetical protein